MPRRLVSKFLIDKFGRKHNYLRISLTERCNLRCRYCMPEEGVKLAKSEDFFSIFEFKRLSQIFVRSCGVEKIRLTGGEPTVDRNLIPMLSHLNDLRQDGLKTIAMTTNGISLERQSAKYKSMGKSR